MTPTIGNDRLPLISDNTSVHWQLIPIGDIIVRERQRKVNDGHVKSLRASFASLGGQLQLQPIVVDENNILVDGAHRLAAALAEGWTHISAIVISGITDDDRALLEAEANRVRLQLTPLELAEAWSTIYEPAFKARAKKNQLAGLKRGAESPVTVNSGNGESESEHVSLPRAAKDATGISLDTINKIISVRTMAQSTTASDEFRHAAEKGLEKLDRPSASVDTVYKALLKLQEREQRHKEDPAETERRNLEKRLDQTLTETSLLAEKLGGELGHDLAAAARLEQVAQETLRGIRVALTHALAHVVAIECSLDPEPAAALRRVGGESTRTLSELTIARLELEVDDG